MPSLDRPRIVLHAGRGKAGSTAIQDWLRRSPDVLRDHGLTLVVARPTEGCDLLRVAPYDKGHGNSGGVVRLLQDRTTRREAIARLTEGLRRETDAHGRIVISGEAFSQLLERLDGDLIARLNDLGRSQGLRVAYYVRPQHSALEAAWRQWGFRRPEAPSAFLATQAERLNYLEVLDGMAARAPDVDLRTRPFHRDLLVSGDVVEDFVREVLEIRPAPVPEGKPMNVGLPLVAVNLLATRLGTRLWGSPHDNKRLAALKAALDREDDAGRELRSLLASVERRDSGTERGRRLLQGWAHRTFQAENEELLRRMEWRVREWIPVTGGEPGELAALDDLWTPPVSGAELDRLRELVEQATRDAIDFPLRRRPAALEGSPR